MAACRTADTQNRSQTPAARGCRFSLRPFLLEGSVRNALAKSRFRDRPLAKRAARTPLEKTTAHERWPSLTCDDVQAEPGPRKQLFTCVPHTDGFVGLLDVPGLRASAPAPRSCELSPGHALEPSAPFAVVSPNASQASDPQDIRGRQSLRTSASRSTPRDHRDALRIGTGHGQNIPTRDKVKTNFRGRGERWKTCRKREWFQ